MKNILADNMRRFHTKNLTEQQAHLGGLGMNTNTITIDGMPATEVHNLIVVLIKKNPTRAKAVIAKLAKTWTDVGLLQTYLDSYKYNTIVDPRMGVHMINPKQKALTQAFINDMTM